MENKINIAELLRDCPQGIELDCTIWDSEVKVFLKRVFDDDFTYPIEVTVKYNNTEYSKTFTKYGTFNDLPYCKCVIFPKGKTTWEGFVPPCEFKDGDIVVTTDGAWIGITEGGKNHSFIPTYCVIKRGGKFEAYFNEKRKWYFNRLATEDEKQKLFQAIKDNGYRWDEKTKTLEELVEPRFKVGDRIKHKCLNFRGERIITSCNEAGYFTTINDWIDIEHQDDWELVPNKFDINTLVPFESRVLVRGGDSLNEWKPAIFGIYRNKYNNFYAVGGIRCGDLCDLETRVIHPAFDIVGVIVTRRKNRPGCTKQIKCVQTADGKMYRLDRLTNIRHI